MSSGDTVSSDDDDDDKSEAEHAKLDPFDVVRASWGFPAFARSFPRDRELDGLVEAFARGDFAAVREGVPRIAARSDASDDVKRAANVLRARIEPDPTSRILFLLAAALLVFLTIWWVGHNGPESAKQAKPTVSPPKIEHVD